MGRAHVRPATFEDHAAVMQLRRRHGMRQIARDEWEHIFFGPPRLAEDSHSRTLGWIVEEPDGRVAGFLGSIPVPYEHDGRPVLGAAMNSWAIDAPHRAHSLYLTRSFLRQEGVALALNTTANEAAGRALEALRFARIPVDACDRCLFWITHPVGFARSALRRRIPALATPLAPPLGAALALSNALRRARRRAEAEVAVVDGFDERFDAFWAELRERRGLRFVRDRESLAWAFRFPLLRGDATVLAASREGRMLAYVVLLRHDAPEIGLRRQRIIDLQFAEDAEPAVRDLLGAAIECCRSQDVHVLESIGFGARTRRALVSLAPRERALPAWPFYYKAIDAGIRDALTGSDAWDPCQLDGDACFQ